MWEQHRCSDDMVTSRLARQRFFNSQFFCGKVGLYRTNYRHWNLSLVYKTPIHKIHFMKQACLFVFIFYYRIRHPCEYRFVPPKDKMTDNKTIGCVLELPCERSTIVCGMLGENCAQFPYFDSIDYDREQYNKEGTNY
jgi:hypothetical protein